MTTICLNLLAICLIIVALCRLSLIYLYCFEHADIVEMARAAGQRPVRRMMIWPLGLTAICAAWLLYRYLA